MPRFVCPSRFRYGCTAVLAFMALALWGGRVHAQSPDPRDRDRFAVPTVDPEITAPLEGFRRQIDPDSQGDPFASDRRAEDELDRLERAQGAQSLSGDGETGLNAQNVLDGTDGAENAGQSDGPFPDDPAAEAEDLRDETVAAVDQVAAQTEESLVTGPYEPIGVRLGSFLLFPEVTTGLLTTDNVLITEVDPQSDHAYYIEPKLALRSNWSRHYFEANLGMERSYYSKFSLQDDNNYNIDLLGRLDVSRRTQLEATAEHERTLESIDSPDAPEDAAERTPIITSGGSLRVTQGFNRLTASLRGTITEYDYENVPMLGGGIVDNDDRDYTERELTGRLAYEFRPGVTGFVEGSGNKRVFVRPIDDNGINRGSEGGEVLAGLAVDLGGKLKGEIAAGYAQQTPDETDFDDISGFVFDAGLTWTPTALTTVKFTAGSQIQETTQVDSPGSLVHLAVLAVDHAFRRNLIAGISLGYSHEEFEGSGEIDKDYVFGLNGEYLLNRSVAVVADYEHIKSTSTDPEDGDTTENRFRVGVRLRR